MTFYRAGREGGDFDTGIEMALRRILADPDFVFRFERDPANVPAGGAYRLTDLELASRLSFFLWSSIPDDELLQAAEQGKLKDPAVAPAAGPADAEAIRDRRRWSPISPDSGCSCASCATGIPTCSCIPDFDDNLRQAFQRETELLFDSIVREDRSVFDLMNADYTFVNERLARHYGIPERLRQRLPARRRSERRAPRTAGTGQHPDRDVRAEPHVAGDARRLDSREPAGQPAAAAAAERAAVPGKHELARASPKEAASVRER